MFLDKKLKDFHEKCMKKFKKGFLLIKRTMTKKSFFENILSLLLVIVLNLI